jgi:putative endonuclease
MLRCSDVSLYMGIAVDVEDRVKRHNSRIGARYTAERRPLELVSRACCGSAEAARAREKEIRGGWSRKKKIELIERRQGKPFARLTRAQGKGESSNG